MLKSNNRKKSLWNKKHMGDVMKITVWIHASCAHTALISFSLIVFAFHASGLYLVWVIFAFTAVLLTCLFFRFVRCCSSRFKFIKILTTGLRCHSLQYLPSICETPCFYVKHTPFLCETNPVSMWNNSVSMWTVLYFRGRICIFGDSSLFLDRIVSVRTALFLRLSSPHSENFFEKKDNSSSRIEHFSYIYLK